MVPGRPVVPVVPARPDRVLGRDPGAADGARVGAADDFPDLVGAADGSRVGPFLALVAPLRVASGLGTSGLNVTGGRYGPPRNCFLVFRGNGCSSWSANGTPVTAALTTIPMVVCTGDTQGH